MQAEWADFRLSLLSQVQDIRVEMLQLRAYTALAILAGGDTSVGPAVVRRDGRRLRRDSGVPWPASTPSVALFSACSCWTLSALVGNGAGADIRVATQAWFDQQRIRRPDRMAAVYAPGFPE